MLHCPQRGKNSVSRQPKSWRSPPQQPKPKPIEVWCIFSYFYWPKGTFQGRVSPAALPSPHKPQAKLPRSLNRRVKLLKLKKPLLRLLHCLQSSLLSSLSLTERRLENAALKSISIRSLRALKLLLWNFVKPSFQEALHLHQKERIYHTNEHMLRSHKKRRGRTWIGRILKMHRIILGSSMQFEAWRLQKMTLIVRAFITVLSRQWGYGLHEGGGR